MISLHQDFRYAARRLRRTPGFTVTAVLTLALGIAAHTAFFSVVNAIAFKPIPVARLDGVYSVQAVRPTGEREPSVSLAGLRALERELPDGVLAVAAHGIALDHTLVHAPGRAEQRRVESVNAGFAATFGLSAQHGRWISAEDDRVGASPPGVVISDRLWREWFGGDPAIVQRTVLTIHNKTRFRVVGIAPPGFTGLMSRQGVHTDAWISITDALAAVQISPQYLEIMELQVFIRARPTAAPRTLLEGPVHGVLSGQQAPKEVEPPVRFTPSGTVVLKERVTTSHALVPAAQALASATANRAAGALLLLSGLVLLAAGANFANLLFARIRARTGELALRLSLGAGRWRAVRLLLAEATLLGAAAGVLGLILGIVLMSAFAARFPMLQVSRSLRLAFDFSPDVMVGLNVLGVAVFTAMTVGLATAWRATGSQPVAVLTSASAVSGGATARRSRTQTVLVAVQVTAAVLLVMSAGLFVERLRTGLSDRRHVHYDAEPLSVAHVNVSLHDYPEARGRVFFDRLLREARALAGVQRAALTSGLPPTGRTTIVSDDPPGGRAGEPPRAYAGFMRLSPGFFGTLGLELRAGRDFGAGDDIDAPAVAILSESAADALWPGQDPLGRRLVLDRNLVTVVGVSPNVESGLSGPRERYPGSERFPGTRPSNYIFVPFTQQYSPSMFLVVRSPEARQAEALRAAARRIDDNVAVLQADTVTSLLDRQGALWAATAMMLTLATVALAIAMLGVYGVVSFFVSSRTREFGIRMALGATPRGLMKLVFDYSLHIVIVGLLPAVFIAAVGSRLIESRQFDLMPNEISTWVVVPLLLVAASLVAGYFPARRAARTDPNVCLREL